MIHIDLQSLARALGGKIVNGEVLAPGPNHSLGDRSLSVRLDSNAPDGFIVHSHSPADSGNPIALRDYVRAKAGLPAFKPNGKRRFSSEDILARTFAAAMGTLESQKRKIVARFDYRDANGALLYQVRKYDPKGFSQHRPDGKGGWIDNLEGVQRVPYRLQEILKYPDATVFVCEGEKDANRVIADIKVCATTVASGKWTPECVAALAGRDVVILEDNDDAGRKKAIVSAMALYGTAKTIRIVSLPDLPIKGDVSDWLDADPSRAERFVDVCFSVPEWVPGPDDAKVEIPSEAKSDLPLPFINIAAWHDQPVPQREWTVKDRIPANNVTLLSGEGSIGKSILSLQLATAVVLGRDWLNTLPEMGPALVICCEDDETELWRRLDLIFAHYGAAYTDFKNMHLMALAGKETLMAAPDRNGIIQSTKLFGRIREAACDIRPKLIVLDNSADIFGGSENDRAEVRQFIGLLRGMAIASGSGVLLTSHPSLTGINTGTGLSGSTAWNASVRSRLYFKRAITEKDEEPDPDLRVLECMKSNYGPVGETINLRWKNGLFLPVASIGNLEKLAAEQRADTTFLALLKLFTDQGQDVNHTGGHIYAPARFAKHAQSNGITSAAFAKAMQRLLDSKKIKIEQTGRPSWPSRRIIFSQPEA